MSTAKRLRSFTAAPISGLRSTCTTSTAAALDCACDVRNPTTANGIRSMAPNVLRRRSLWVIVIHLPMHEARQDHRPKQGRALLHKAIDRSAPPPAAHSHTYVKNKIATAMYRSAAAVREHSARPHAIGLTSYVLGRRWNQDGIQTSCIRTLVMLAQSISACAVSEHRLGFAARSWYAPIVWRSGSYT